MTEVAETKQDKIARRQVDKFEGRRTELAVATLHTLAELGYARTSLREIAQNSEFSHGVLHYYFADKRDLITHAVRQYEAVCVTRYDEAVASATTAAELKSEFAGTFFGTLKADAALHRLWYDLRNQSLFEESFREDVLEIDEHREAMIWRVISRYAELSGGEPATSPATAYLVLDGVFQRALLHSLSGMDESVARLEKEFDRVLDLLVTI
ncbi:TetR family transcriptional regulator [Prauserella marina]|uniref:DNA-binding transcriptional regulator, AcrR family n=1 Tax=Prauserella marina TaxID=530584 RepID=A0A222VST6_9PSEU|nr:TetR/AcrR family transcriptional regulator [Prauserella marina]ASR37005.1 TetR family transcriptional regulator [Prauserella marina]PWV80021.1 TetR family transcriptional regulator [Prauserella marina]SDD84907.1 DNA-binding transcriptional regulator, AcrR family [Prauserella marina]